MYSRYTPDGSGGFHRQQVPEAADLWQQGRPPPPPEPPPEPDTPATGQEAPAILPPRRAPTGHPPSGSSPGRLPDLGETLARLLPKGLDTEDLLILAVLLLSLKQDGADPIQLLIAIGIYLWL